MNRQIKSGVVPKYRLYGEAQPDPEHDVDQHFLHVESLDKKGIKHDWMINPHVHADLHQLVFMESGSGNMDIDTSTFELNAPVIISVPAQVVHGFRFAARPTGWIATYATTMLWRNFRSMSEFDTLLHHPIVISVGDEQCAMLRSRFANLNHELSQSGADNPAAELILFSMLVELTTKQRVTTEVTAARRNADYDLVLKFRKLIEENFRSRMGAADYASKLCVCHEKLRIACSRIAGLAPLSVLNARRLLEAKRCLIYSNLSIAEVAYQSGFVDPAYFSRFFVRTTGKTPRQFRLSKGTYVSPATSRQ